MKHCCICGGEIGENAKWQFHHIYGKNRSLQKKRAHKKCHQKYHQLHDVYLVEFTEEAMLEEVRRLDKMLLDAAKPIKKRLTKLQSELKMLRKSGDMIPG